MDFRIADTALRKSGVVDTRLDTINDHAQRTIESHLSDYEAKLRTGGRTEAHVAAQCAFIRKCAAHAGWTVAADIDADGANAFAGSMKQTNKAAQTIKNHLRAVKGFTKWLYTNGKLPHDPLVSVHLPNAKADRRSERRMLLPDEWTWPRYDTSRNPTKQG